MYDIKNKICLVTGGAEGIGQSVVRALLEDGAKHVAILDSNDKTGNVLEKQLGERYGEDRVTFHPCDVTTDQLSGAYQKVLVQHGYIDVVVNNAGILADHPEGYEKCIAVNLTAVIRSSYKAFNIMRKDKGGRGGAILNVASIAALDLGTRCIPVYNATKSGVLRFSTNLGAEPNFALSGVRVITICFGATDTAILTTPNAFDESLNDELRDVMTASVIQTPKHAALSLVHALKYGSSASTWLVMNGLPAQDVTSNVLEAHELMGRSLIQ